MTSFVFDTRTFITAAQFEAWTGVLASTLTPNEQLKIEMRVDAICASMIDFCSLDGFKSTSYTEVFDGNGSDLLIPRMYPISAITSVKFAMDGVFTGVPSFDSTEYSIDSCARYIVLRDGILSPRGRGCLQVVYTAGHTSIPKSLIGAFFKQYDFDAGAGGNNVGIKSINKMNESCTFDSRDGGLISEVRSILEPYRRIEPASSTMFMRCT
jgi:hypothetical protein